MTIARKAAASAAIASNSTKKPKLVKASATKASKSTKGSSDAGTSAVTPTSDIKHPKKTTTSKNAAASSTLSSLPTTVASKVDRLLIEKAVAALLKHHAEVTEKNITTKGKLPLLESQTVLPIQVQFGLEVAPSQKKIKPIRIHIPHSIYQLSSSAEDDDTRTTKESSVVDEAELCLIVKDDATKTHVVEMKEQFPQYMKNISKVVTLSSLRSKYSEYNQRRLLLSQFTHFIADDRILPMLTSTLGKDFIAAKKQPIPISMTRKSVLPHSIKNAILHATYLFIPDGTCITVRAGYTSQTTAQIVDNILSIMVHVPSKVPRGWANIQNIQVKLPTSIALPIYNQTPSELIDIAQMAGVPAIWVADADLPPKNAKKPKGSATTDARPVVADTNAGSTAANDKTNKTKKSPLLKAIAKQKKEETSKDDKKETKIDETSKTKKSPAATKRKNDSPEDVNQEIPSSESNKKKKIQPKRDSKEDMKVETGTDESIKKKKKKEQNSPLPVVQSISNETKGRKDVVVNNDSTTNETSKKAFIAAKKFQGRKVGYVFHMGAMGLGYYIDQPPKVLVARSKSFPLKHKSPTKSNNHNKNNKKQRRSR